MSEDAGYVERIYAAADGVGSQFGITAAEHARLAFDRLRDEGDDEATDGAAVDGIAMHLRKRTSYRRQAVQSHVMTALSGDTERDAVVQASLFDYPVTLPGEQTIRLGQATRMDILIALHAIQSQRQGIDRTERQLNQLYTALDGMPEDEPVALLVATGRISVDALFGAVA